jgi:hypothetical protein
MTKRKVQKKQTIARVVALVVAGVMAVSVLLMTVLK